MVGSQGGPVLEVAMVRGTRLEYSPFQQNWGRIEAEGTAVLLYCVLRTVDSDSKDAARSIGEAVAETGVEPPATCARLVCNYRGNLRRP